MLVGVVAAAVMVVGQTVKMEAVRTSADGCGDGGGDGRYDKQRQDSQRYASICTFMVSSFLADETCTRAGAGAWNAIPLLTDTPAPMFMAYAPSSNWGKERYSRRRRGFHQPNRVRPPEPPA